MAGVIHKGSELREVNIPDVNLGLGDVKLPSIPERSQFSSSSPESKAGIVRSAANLARLKVVSPGQQDHPAGVTPATELTPAAIVAGFIVINTLLTSFRSENVKNGGKHSA
jgi:hypothetical protein